MSRDCVLVCIHVLCQGKFFFYIGAENYQNLRLFFKRIHDKK